MQRELLALVEGARDARDERSTRRPPEPGRRRARAGRRRSGAPRSGTPGAGGRSTRSACARRSTRCRREGARSVRTRPSSRRRRERRSAGNIRVKICVRVEWRCVYRPSTERRARGQREQLGQVAANASHGDGPIGAVNADVDVDPERVVAPRDVAQALLHAPVVRRVDDRLLLPGAPGMRSGRAERGVEASGELDELAAALGHRGGRLRERLAAARAHLHLEAMSSPTRCPSSSVPCAAAKSSSKRPTISRVRGSRMANSSSTATVKSRASSNCSRARRSCSSELSRWASPTARK